MAPEKAPETTDASDESAKPDVGDSSGSDQSMGDRINAVLLDPYRLLVAIIIVGASVGIGQLITDYFAFSGDWIGQTKGILNDLFNIVAVGGFLIGLLAVAKGIRIYQGREKRVEPEDWMDKAKDPIWIMGLYPYLLAYVSLLHAVFFILEFEAGRTRFVLTVAFGQMWLTALTVFIVISLRLGVLWLLKNATPAKSTSAPSGAQEDAASKASADAKPAATAAKAESGNTKSWKWLGETIENPDRLLTLGAYAIAYTGMLSQVFMVWTLKDFREGQLWSLSVEMLAGIIAGVGIILLVRTLLRTLNGQAAPEGEVSREKGENVVHWIERLMNNPLRGPLLILGVSWVLGVIYYLVLVWDSRNFPPANFWATILPANMIGTIVTASLLSVWAMVYNMKATGGDVAKAMSRAASGWFFKDPVRILRIGLYSVAYFGLIYASTQVFSVRNADGTQVWYWFFNAIGRTIVIAGPLIGLRAVFEELKQAPAVATAPRRRTRRSARAE